MARIPFRILGLLLTFGSITIFLSCQPSPKTDRSKSSGSEAASKSATQAGGAEPDMSLLKRGEMTELNTAGKEEKPASKHSKSQTPSPPPTIPNVGLTDSLRATCLVGVDDLMPGGDLLAADGKKISLQSQYGEKLTVVFLWAEGGSNYARLTADAALHDLQSDVVEPFAGKGIKVIGINVGDRPQLIRQELEKSGLKLSFYFDPDKAFFAKVAKSLLPRIYLVDASGKIIWFDTQYSQGTRKNLIQAILAVLGEK